jgi:hypothetical protein
MPFSVRCAVILPCPPFAEGAIRFFLAGAASDRLRRDFAAPAIVTDQARALHTPDALRVGQDSHAILQEGLLFFDLHDAPSPSFDLRRVGDVGDDRIGTRGRLAICETSRFPSMLSHLCRRLPYRSVLPAGELNENQKRDGAPQAALS